MYSIKYSIKIFFIWISIKGLITSNSDIQKQWYLNEIKFR